jgi:hypothetical protein
MTSMNSMTAGMLPFRDSSLDPKVAEVGEIPIREVSGLALRERGDRQVLAVGDHDFELAVGNLRGGAVDAFEVIDLGEALQKAGIERQGTSQWEGVKSDASGRVFVLEENPGHVFVFDEAGTRLIASIELAFRTKDPALAKLQKDWKANPNSRSEGLLLLEGGHVLVLKEKEPRRLIEFGPVDEPSVGLQPLPAESAFALPRGKICSMVPLRAWKLSDESKIFFPDCSDMDLDERGRLWIASDEGQVIGRLTRDVRDGRLAIASITKLPDKPKFTKPEGLALLSCTRALVACDNPGRNTPLFSVALNRSPR